MIRSLPRRLTLAMLLLLALWLAGCGVFGLRLRSPIVSESDRVGVGPAQLTPTQIQSELMSFTDTFDSAVAQGWNRVAAQGRELSVPGGLISPEDGSSRAGRMRRAALENKIASVSAALSIASSPNPWVGLADMITMITLQRMVLEDKPAQELYGPELGPMIVGVYKEQEEGAWRVARKIMTPQQQEDLHQIIEQWRAEHPGSTYVANVRLEDFAAARQQTVAPREHSTGNLLSLIALDPLAGLDPTQREVQKSRLLAERMFFYASRSPQLLKWQVESLYQELMRTPELQNAVNTAGRAVDSAHMFAEMAHDLPGQVATERAAAIDQLFDRLREERRATIADIDRRLAEQRTALVNQIEQAQGPLRESMQDYRKAVEATDRAAASIKETVAAVDALAGRFGAGNHAPPEPGAPTGVEKYESAISRTAEAADRLTTLAQQLGRLLSSPALGAEPQGLTQTVADVQARSKGVIDYAFWRLLALVLIAPVWTFATAWVYYAAKQRTIRRP